MHFTSDFPGGNGQMTACVRTEKGYEISFRAETKAYEPQPLWFYFEVSGLVGEKAVFRLTNAVCTLGGLSSWKNDRPVYRFGKTWKRCEPASVITTEALTYEAVFEIPVEGDRAQVAFCYPYGEGELMETVSQIPGIRKALIGYSAMGRPMYRYAFGLGDEQGSKPGIYCIARQHAAEVTGSWLMDGMMRFLGSDEGKALLEKYVIWFVPFADADGAELGWYGKDQIWGDLNRAWGPGVVKRPEIRALTMDMRTFANRARVKCVLDLHAPGHGETEHYFSYDGAKDSEETWHLRHITAEISDDLMSHGRDPIRILFHSGRVTSARSGYTMEQYIRQNGWRGSAFEASYQGDTKGHYDIDDYRRLGVLLLKAVLAE